MQRANISMAIVCMVGNKTCHHSLESLTQLTNESKFDDSTLEEKIKEYDAKFEYNTTQFNNTQCKTEGFDWSKTIQGIILSLVFFGMLLSQVRLYLLQYA